jgi:trans-aconitate 2-methyltransferase
MSVPEPTYAFGDSAMAAERLEIVAETFAPTTRALLQSLETNPRRILDLGCGPGHSTALLASLYPSAEVVAVDLSESFASQARARVPVARVIVADVTETLPDGFDLVYSRFLLSHLPDVEGTVANWCCAVAPGGLLVMEEPESIVAVDPLFARYEQIVAAVVAASGADMYAGAALARGATPPGFRRRVDDAVDPRVTAGAAASMFWRNARAWDPRNSVVGPDDVDALVDALRRRVDDPSLDAIQWRLRRLVLARDPAPAASGAR